MADTKWSALGALTAAAVATSDLFVLVDVSDTTMAASGTDKSLTATEARLALANWTEVEIDFGTVSRDSKRFTITDSRVAASSRVAVVPSGATATGRAPGDMEWDSLTLAALPASGSFVVYAVANPGPVVGKRKILYSVAA
jgi:hypothetical protein